MTKNDTPRTSTAHDFVSPHTGEDRRLTYHNRCVAADCGIGMEEADLIAASPRCTFDDCANIIAIDNRSVLGGNCVYKLAGA